MYSVSKCTLIIIIIIIIIIENVAMAMEGNVKKAWEMKINESVLTGNWI